MVANTLKEHRWFFNSKSTLKDGHGFHNHARRLKFLYEIESGRKGFSANNLYNIAKGLSVSCEYIMDGNEHASMQVDQLLKSLSSLSLRQRRKMYDILQDFSKFIFVEAEGGRAI